jgi:hypothetical protein
LALLVWLAASPALGQYEAVIQACRMDVKATCADALPADGRLRDCIKANFQNLGQACQAALVQIEPVRAACGADIRTQCADIKPGAGRILLCVKAHYAALSEPCRDAIGHAAERHMQAH